MADELEAYLGALQRDDSYRVERVLKEGPVETTELVYFVGVHGGERGPFVRKRFTVEQGLGSAYLRIWEEQRAGVRFSHLPRIEECYSTGEQLVVVSEYVRGETLGDVLYRCDPSIAFASDVFPRLCDAVAELHTSFTPPIIHRDLKPSNVILSPGSLMLIDFGIARSYDAGADADTHRYGTRAYAPPEQFGYGQTDVRSDVYALGLLLFYLLTERTPDACARKRGWRAPGINEPLRAVILKAASFDPDDRYGSVGELKAAFLRALSGQVESGGEASPARALRDSLCSFLPSIPPALGVAWDVAIAFVLAIFLAASVNSALNPLPDSVDAAAPVWLRLLAYLVMFFFLIVPLGILICDRRPLKRWVKPFASVSLPRQIGACLIVAVFGLCATGIVTLFFPR